MLIAAIASEGSSCQSGNHVSPPSTDLWTPPAAAPAYMIRGSDGSTASALTRPPMLRGPVGIQLCSPATGARGPVAFVIASPGSLTLTAGSRALCSSSGSPGAGGRTTRVSQACLSSSGASNANRSS